MILEINITLKVICNFNLIPFFSTQRASKFNEMLGEWRVSTIISLYKKNEVLKTCDNYGGIKLPNHTINL